MTKLEIGAVLLSAERIAEGVAAVAARINRDYGQRPIVLVGVLTGAVVFMSDLMRQLRMPVLVDCVELASYGDATESSGKVHIVKNLSRDVRGLDVLVVEDIVDTGRSLQAALTLIGERQPASLRAACLLSKPSRREADVQCHYVAFEIPDAFVVGYGLDYAQRYRNLPHIAMMRQQAGNETGN